MPPTRTSCWVFVCTVWSSKVINYSTATEGWGNMWGVLVLGHRGRGGWIIGIRSSALHTTFSWLSKLLVVSSFQFFWYMLNSHSINLLFILFLTGKVCKNIPFNFKCLPFIDMQAKFICIAKIDKISLLTLCQANLHYV